MFDEIFLHRELNLGPKKASSGTNNLIFALFVPPKRAIPTKSHKKSHKTANSLHNQRLFKRKNIIL